MKIDFDKNGMNLKLDKVPRLIYINEDGNGCGQIFENGVKIKLLQKIEIEAKQTDNKVHFLKYKIESYNEKTHGSEIRGQNYGTPIKDLTVEVKIADMDIFNELLDTLRLVTSNERVPMDIRENFINKINNILERD